MSFTKRASAIWNNLANVTKSDIVLWGTEVENATLRDFPSRSVENVQEAKTSLSDGSYFTMAGVGYVIDSTVALSDSATEDLGEAGIGLPQSANVFDVWADIALRVVPLPVLRISVTERTAGAGVISGSVLERQSSEPDVPAFAKTQDADGAWFKIVGDIIRPEQLGAMARPVIETETQAWYDALTVKPNLDLLNLIDIYILSLRGMGVWDKLDALYILCGESASDSMINVRNPGTGDLTEMSAMTFVPGVGFTAGSGGKLASVGYSPSSMVNYGQDDAHLAVLSSVSGDRDNSPLFGADDATDDAYIVPLRSSSDAMRARLNSDNSIDFPNTKSRGHFCVVRDSAASVRGYRNGELLGDVADVSTGVPTVDLEFGNVTGSDGTGTLALAHAGGALTITELRIIAVLSEELISSMRGLVNTGTPVTAAEIALPVDLTVNTSAMNAFASLATFEVKGILAGNTYLMEDTFIIPDYPNLQGVYGRTRIRSDATMTNTKATARIGDGVRQAYGGTIDGITFDYNLDRSLQLGGGAGDDTDGDAFAIHAVFGGSFTNIIGTSGRKHGVDLLSRDYNRSGTPYTYNQRHDLKCSNIYMDNVGGRLNGDDAVTGHQLEDSSGGTLWGELGRATFAESNSNGVEFDDFTRNVRFLVCRGRFVHRPVEIKGHDDAYPAENVTIGLVTGSHSSIAQVRHINHGDTGEPQSPGKGNIKIARMDIIKPLKFNPSDDPDPTQTQVFTAYAYKGIDIDILYGRADGCADQVTNQVVEFLWSADSPRIGYLDLSGFTSATQGLKIDDSVGGVSVVDTARIIDSGLNRAVDVDDGSDLIISNYVIEKTTGVSGEGIYGFDGHVKLGQGFISGYTTDISITN